MDTGRERRIFAIVVFCFIAIATIVSSAYVLLKDEDVKGIEQKREVIIYPYITNLMPTNAYVGEEYVFVPRVSSSGDGATIIVIDGPNWLRVDDEGIVRGFPDVVGTFKVILKVEDSLGSSQITDYIIVEENE
jgi:hypothetical protein